MKISIFFLIIGMLTIFMFGYMHEQAHIAIYKSYGVKAEATYFANFPDMTTTAEKPCPTDTCFLANNINEIVGYPLLVILTTIILGFFLTIFVLEIKNGN